VFYFFYGCKGRTFPTQRYLGRAYKVLQLIIAFGPWHPRSSGCVHGPCAERGRAAVKVIY